MLLAFAVRLRRSQRNAPIAASTKMPSGIPTPSPTFAPVLRPAESEFKLCWRLLLAVGRLDSSVAVVCIDTELNNVLVDDVDAGSVLSLIGLVAVAYTIGSPASNVRSSMVQHVVLMSALDFQSCRLPPT